MKKGLKPLGRENLKEYELRHHETHCEKTEEKTQHEARL